MRVLLVPEVYRPADLTSNGTVNDAVAWVEEWLRRDGSLHVYWLLPPRDAAGYDAEAVLADRERVTLVEARPFMHGDAYEELFTETGYTRAQLYALKEAIFDRNAYVDVVIDGLRTGRRTLYKWLLEHADQWAANVRPFDVVANVHDLQLPFKHRGCSYRNEYQALLEVCAAAFADGIWFTAGVDARCMREYAAGVLRPDVVDGALDGAVETVSPIDLDRFEESYRDAPRWLHVAGSLWEKKHADEVLEIARTLHDRFGIRTVMTSVEPLPAAVRAPGWIDAYPEADRETYRRALERGDVAVCASEYETMARTPFEQAASGQVLVVRDEPWIDDCVPADYPLAGDPEDLPDLAAWAVENWDAAVAANRRLVEHVSTVRSPERCGRRTYEDLRRRVDRKTERFTSGEHGAVVERALGEFDDRRVPLDALIERTAAFADDGAPVTDRSSCAFSDVVYTLRSLGYEDAGNPGTPAFGRADAG